MRPDPVTRLVAAPSWARAAPWDGGSNADTWFRDHAHDLADRFAGPLLERHRAAAEARWPAVRAKWRLDTLAEDAAAATHDTVALTLDAHQGLARRAVAGRRLGRKGRRAAAVPAATRLALRRAADAAADALQPPCAALRRAQDRSLWESGVERLEMEWADAWEELGRALAAAWRQELGPALERLERLRPGPPAWLLPLLLAVLAAIVALVWVVL